MEAGIRHLEAHNIKYVIRFSGVVFGLGLGCSPWQGLHLQGQGQDQGLDPQGQDQGLKAKDSTKD